MLDVHGTLNRGKESIFFLLVVRRKMTEDEGNKWYYNTKTGEVDSYTEEEGFTDFSRGLLVTYGDYIITGFDSKDGALSWATSWSPCHFCNSAKHGRPGDKCPTCKRPLSKPVCLPKGVSFLKETTYEGKKGICWKLLLLDWEVRFVATNSGAKDHEKLQPIGYPSNRLLEIGQSAITGVYIGPEKGELFSVDCANKAAIVLLPNQVEF